MRRPWPASRPWSTAHRARGPGTRPRCPAGRRPPDDLDLDIDEIETALAPSFLKVRVRDVSVPALTEGPLPSPTRSPARSSATSRRASRNSRPPARSPRPPSSATPFVSGGCCSPATRSRCEGPPPRGGDFRRYRDRIDLSPGVTVIRGPNEAGKTTIQRALELALTRRVTSTRRPSSRPSGRGSAARGPLRRDHRVRAGRGGRLEVGTLEKTFAGTKGTVGLEYEGQAITDPALADQVMAELTGIPTEGFFRSTASVRHFELSDRRATRAPCATGSRPRSAAQTAARAGRAGSSTGRSTT